MLNHQLLEKNMNYQIHLFNLKKKEIRPYFSHIMRSLADGIPMNVIVDAFKASGLDIKITMMKSILKVLEKESAAEAKGDEHSVTPVRQQTFSDAKAPNAVPPVTGHRSPAHTYGHPSFGPLNLSTVGLAEIGLGHTFSPFGQGGSPTFFNPNQMSYPGMSSQSNYAGI